VALGILPGMGPASVGGAIRALRRRAGLTQAELAARAHVSQAAVSRLERGRVGSLTLRTTQAVAEALDARATLRILWHGEALDRLLDAAHAGLVDQVVTILRSEGWEVIAEATFSVYGERGSIDVLAFHPAHGALLIVEVKSVVPDMQGMLGSLDRKVRLAPRLADERGWRVQSVSRLIVLADDRTARRRVEEHEAALDLLFPERTAAVRRWIAWPDRALGGILFLPRSQRTTTGQRVRARRGSNGPKGGRIPAR
jgi:transcriptional regulator with XRE-family HTH domain